MSSEKHIMKRKKVPFLSFALLSVLIMGCVFVYGSYELQPHTRA